MAIIRMANNMITATCMIINPLKGNNLKGHILTINCQTDLSHLCGE